ncbi:MAG: T9SS type A sorting domain-containing protein, partial [Chitinophagaceae bacterium]
DQAFALSASPSGGTFSGTGVSSGQFTPTAAGVGAKVVTYTATNAGCTAAVSKTIIVNECAERHISLDKKPAIVVYPNPNNGAFTIGVKTDLYSTLNIKVYNARGQEVSSQNGVSVYYGSLIPINLFNIPSGTYLLYISGNANGQMHKRGDRVIIYK